MITELDTLEAMHIADHMRASDRAEVLAVTAADTVRNWIRGVCRLPGVGLMVVADGEPVAMGGGLVFGHMAGMWFVATDRIAEPAVRIDCHRLALESHRLLAKQGVRRCQVVAFEGNREIPGWLGRMGYMKEGIHPGYGRQGETFCTWAKLMEAPHGN